MTYKEQYLTRKVRRTTEEVEVWSTSAGHKDFIIKDGNLAFSYQVTMREEVLEEFRPLTEFELKLLKGFEIGS